MDRKTCNRCDVPKPYADFGYNVANKDGYDTICKTCVKETREKRRSAHPEDRVRRRALQKLGISRNRDYIYNHLQGRKCVDCGEARWQVLEFDHMRDKVQSISWMVCRGYSLTRIQTEIDKCEIRCGNCHRIKSTKELGSFKVGGGVLVGDLGKYRQRNRQFIYDTLTQSSCVDCGTTTFEVLEFDHVRGEKLYSITYIVHHGMSLDTLKNELEKCEVRCVNCHRLKTIEQFGWAKATWTVGQLREELPPKTREKRTLSPKTKKIMSDMRQGLKPPVRSGEDSNLSVLTEQQVREIRSPELSSISGAELARRYGVSPNAISRVRLEHTWKHLL
jgi:hypothetical protein